MKIYSSLVLAVTRWWAQAGDLLAALGCLRAADELDAPTHASRTSHQERAEAEPLSPSEPPLSARSDATTISLLDSVAGDAADLVVAFTGGLDDPEPLAADLVSVPDSDGERLLVRCADPEREPELDTEAKAEPPAKADAALPAADVEAAAIALARRLVPLTTVTGRFELDPEMSHAATTPEQWKRYSAAKTAFTDAARDYVVACAECDEASESVDDATALVEAYARLTSSPLFEVEQRARDLQWEEAHAEVNAAAFLLVSLTVQAPETEPLLTTVAPVAGQRPLTVLEQRLDDAHALTLFRKTPEQLARAPVSAFDRIDTDSLCLLELRALLHAAGLSKAGDCAWRQQLQDVVRAAKEQFDDCRRAHLCDERGSSQSCFFFGPASEQVLPLYAAPKLEATLTGYCDAEAATH